MRTPHIDTDEQECALWKAYLLAKRQMEIVYGVSMNFYQLDRDLELAESELPERLRSLLLQGRNLLADYEAFRAEIDAAWHSAAWAYVGYVADLHYGDQVEVSAHGAKVIFHCRQAVAEDADPSDFRISGPVARKDGSPGKRSYDTANLFSDDWRLVGRARAAWVEELREFHP